MPNVQENYEQIGESYQFESEITRKHKEETNIFTADLTEAAKSQFITQKNSLSNIILNYQQFWKQKAHNYNKENSINHRHENNSIIEQSLLFNECQKNAFEKNKVKSSLLCLESKKSFTDHEELGLATQIEVEQITENTSSQKYQNTILEESNLVLQQTSQRDILNLEQQKVEGILKKMRSIEQIALVGYWCSLYLSQSKVRWQLTCILLYKQAIKSMQLLKIPLKWGKNGSQKASGYQIRQNIRKMQENYQKSHQLHDGLKQIFFTGGTSRSIFLSIIKESKNLVSDIMKESFSVKTFQFCLFKVLQAIMLVAEINGYIKTENSSDQLSDFSVEQLKRKLIQYKGLQSQYGHGA